jgi:parallel beta-helix repeat protein
LSVKKKVASLAIFTLLILGISLSNLNIKPAKSSPTATIYFDPPSYILSALVPVGYKFNATIRVSDVENLAAWQVCMYYNTTILRVSRYFEPKWDPEYVFYGKSTFFSRFAIGDLCVGACIIPATWENAFSGSGKLVIIEFEILKVPGPGEAYSSILNIDNDRTYLLDPGPNKIPVVKKNGRCEITWLMHDVAVSLDTPTFFNVDSPLLLNVTVWNFGLSNETNVEVYLLINGTIVNYVAIPELLSGQLYSLSHLWVSQLGAVYNITAYVPPVPGDNITTNNLVTKFIKWTGTIYIRADGSIRPQNVPIISYDNVNYVLTGNITSTADGIIVERDSIIIDGNGLTLQGNRADNSKGIDISSRYNITIKNINIQNFYYGVYLEGPLNCNRIIANNIVNNNHGISLDSSSNNSITENNIMNNQYGVVLRDSSNNSIVRNNVANNQYGIRLDSSSNNSIVGNNITNNKYGVYLSYSSNNSIYRNIFINDGLVAFSSYWNVVEDNAVNGKPLVYLENVSNQRVDNAGQVILINCESIIIENLNLSKTDIAIQLWNTTNTKVLNSNITANNDSGIQLSNSSNNNSICGNNIADNGYGIRLNDSSKNSICGNDIAANREWGGGIWLYHSSNNSICRNKITANKYNGIFLSDSSNCNIVSGNTIADNGYGVYLSYSSNNSICENKISANECFSIILWHSSNYNIVSRNNITANHIGVHVGDSSNHNSIIGNKISNNNNGVWLDCSDHNSICENSITNNVFGIYLWQSNYNIVSRNNVTNNRFGIELYVSSNNSIIVSNIINNYLGIRLFYSFGNSISENTIINNGYGIHLSVSSHNVIYHNNFMNDIQVYSYAPTNIWDDSYPSGGNFWSNYIGVDMYSGPYQNETGSDGIGDTPYVIDKNNVDHYPLMNPYSPNPLKPPFIRVTIDIQPQTLNLMGKGKWITAYIELPEGYNVADINTTTIMLNNNIPIDLKAPVEIGDYDNDTIPDLMVNFNRTAVCQFILSKGIMRGNVTLTVSGNLIYGIPFGGCDVIAVKMPGDLNMDGKVDIIDVVIAGSAFGSEPGHPRWNPTADENEDNIIDILDLISICLNFGKTYK